MKSIIILVLLFTFQSLFASPLSNQDEITFFPTSASVVNGEKLWEFPIHDWVYEIEENSVSRQLGRKVIAETLEIAGLNDHDTESKNFKERIKWFLVDNKGNKNVAIQLSKIRLEEAVLLNPTSVNGHAKSNIYLPFRKELYAHRWVKIEADSFMPQQHKVYGEVQLIPAYGLSVISDIDDTIKISEVLDKKKLLKNIFVAPYQTTRGFPELYQRLKEKGAYFHYVSSSPWQLYPSLKTFMEKNYPKGTITLRHFRLKDESFFKFFRSSQQYKINKITAIIKRYPKHHFILIGDSGEHDPEIYAKIYRQFPRNIQSIWIRYVEGSHMSRQRLATDFKDIPRNIWTIFSSPNKRMLQ
ncbi:MAG: hypothetical protein DSZ29_04370 [Aquificaceae bacterium]|nr:MAG: hypothetical protein DSZ29_04370 [Aquificaceae bacterium]